MDSRSSATHALFAVFAACTATAALAQSSPQANEVRLRNGNILRLLAVFESAPASQQAGVRSQAAEALAARAAALESLMRQNPAQAISLAFSGEALVRLATAFPDSSRWLETHGSWRGPVEYLIFDDLNLVTARSRIRMNAPPGALEIHFAGPEPDGLKSGVLLEVRGIRLNATVAAQDGSVQGVTDAALACTPTGNQNVAVILATFPGVTPPNITAASVHNILFGAGTRTVDGYWREASYGQAWATGKVAGWYTLDRLYSCDQYYDMLSAAIRAADAEIDFRTYNRVFVIFPNPGSCSWAGLSNVGCSTYSSPGDGSFPASASWMLATYFTNNDQAVKLVAHEGGHALGLMHSRSRDFGAETLGPLNATGTIAEYGDVASAMGSWNIGHYTAEQKLKLGWLPSANVTTVQNSGSFTVLPAETPAAGTQAVKVQRGTGNGQYLWVEYRQPISNYDSSLPSQVHSGGLIHYRDSTTGSYTDLLDFTAGTSSFSDPSLAAGNTWVDPYTNVSLTMNSASAAGLNLSVSYGPLPCVIAAPAVSLSPANPSVNAGTAANFTVTVRNNDSAGCSASTFFLSSSQPQGWITGFSSSALALAPGQSASVTLTKTAPVSATPGTYPVDATAAGPSSLSGSGTANVTVLAPPPPLSAAVVSSAPSYSGKTAAVLTATVLSGAAPARGANVIFTLTKPGGGQTAQSAKTDAAGKATWNYRFGPKDPAGTYSVRVQATLGTQTATSPSISFVRQ